MIPDDGVEEVRARADIVDIIGEFVSLKKSGKDFKGLSPFTDEKTPSFYVIPGKNFWHCFSSGRSGDVFAFIMERLGLGFVDAVKYVAERSGVPVREISKKDAADDPHRPLFEANAYAKEFFAERLWEWEGGEAARSYLEGRGIDKETAERFGLGYAPDDWRSVREAAARHGIGDEILFEVGLLKKSDRSEEPYDTFRDRIIFPIESLTGRTVAFGGRIIKPSGSGAPKYLNSPETPIYHKGSILYGLSWAKNRIRQEKYAVVVEGYMDVVSLAADDVDNVVATLGTAMTHEHAQLLSKYAEKVLLLFDSDRAGLRATFKAGDILLNVGLRPSVVTLPDGEDPDTIVRKEGRDGLHRYFGQAVDVLDRKLQILEENDYFSSIEGRRKAIDRLSPTLRATKDPALKDIYIARVAERTQVTRETIEKEILRPEPGRPRLHEQPAPSRRIERSRAPRIHDMGPERQLLLVLIRNRAWIDETAERIGPSDFDQATHRTIFQALLDDHELAHPPEEMEPQAVHLLEKLLGDRSELNHPHKIREDLIRRILVRKLQRRIDGIQEEIERTNDVAKKEKLLEEKQRLRKEQQEIAPDDWSMSLRPGKVTDGAGQGNLG